MGVKVHILINNNLQVPYSGIRCSGDVIHDISITDQYNYEVVGLQHNNLSFVRKLDGIQFCRS